jgi:hypothetical protein
VASNRVGALVARKRCRFMAEGLGSRGLAAVKAWLRSAAFLAGW